MSKTVEAVESFYRQLAKTDPNMTVVADMLHSAAVVSNKLNGPKEIPVEVPLKRGVRRLISNIVTPQKPDQQKGREQALKIDLRAQMYELLFHLVEPTDAEKEALRVKRGLVFLPMTAQSYGPGSCRKCKPLLG